MSAETDGIGEWLVLRIFPWPANARPARVSPLGHFRKFLGTMAWNRFAMHQTLVITKAEYGR